MKKKIIIISIIINIITIGIIYNFIKKDYFNNEKIIVKAMTETEYDDNIAELNQSHEEYANYIEESKKKIASAITEMGVETSNEETLETMANNIKSISFKSVKKGTVNIVATAFVEVNLGFKPKFVMISTIHQGSPCFTIIYDEEMSTTTYSRSNMNSGSATVIKNEQLGTNFDVLDYGFKIGNYHSSYAKTATYIAF